ncbi:hypothetical protein QM480_21985 [Flectobacillus sp. DC10W]|uniref:Outer membrane protein beta-barrel domain-containing protein n=1 Tax=Flectobacillus longus TaxID=2984207 RepID=A0ABT6YV75_9BACT|nr:hypothetical protein [Flectobacillus longus]MDI9867026.1 hypothetical protein [Flectobacillus longus]
MSEQESNDIGKVFRSAIDGLSMTPPKAVWENLRMMALQTQIIRYQSINRWLTIYATIVTLLLGGAIIEHFSHSNLEFSITQKNKLVYQTRLVHDTITVTKVIYNNIEKSKDEIPEIEINNNTQISHLPKSTNSLNPLVYDSTFTTKSTNAITDSTSFFVEPHDVEHAEVISQKTVINTIHSKPYSLFIHHIPLASIPYWQYKPQNAPSEKPPKLKIPLKNRLAASVFYAPELGDLIVYRSTPDAFNYGNETIEKAYTWGFRASIDLSHRVSIATGIQLSTIQFAGAVRKASIQPELVNGQLRYLYKTVFGVANIPTNEMTTEPAVNNPISVEMEDEHSVSFVNIPLSVRYNAFSLKLTKGTRNQRYISLYGIGGVNYHIPSSQLMNIEVYESDGHDFYTTLRDFSNTQSYWSYQLGIGAELELGRSTSVWVEPYYNRTINSFVKDLPLQSNLQNTGMKFGLKWHF